MARGREIKEGGIVGQFRIENEDFEGWLLNSKVRWLSKGNCSRCLYSFSEKVACKAEGPNPSVLRWP